MLGPRLFILYTVDLEDHVSEHGVSFHTFADDTQLYVHCRRDEVTSAILQLDNCIEEVSDWMSANRLKLNADKTELLWAGSRHGPSTLGSAGPSLRLRTETVVASDQVRVPWRDNDVRPVSRQARCQRLCDCDVLLLASSAQTVRR